MSVTLEIISGNGNINLTEFLDVEQGKGMEPGDPKFTEKVWARSLLKTGATLALESLREKEQIYPLKLHAATKQALTNLVQELNIIINTAGAQVKWQDEGALVPTFFSLLSGQFDDEFDFRLGQNNWLKGRLRLFTQPLGYPNQKGPRPLMVSGVATTTKVGTSPFVTFIASGLLDGDAEALMQVQMRQATSSNRVYSAVSVLPSSEYSGFVPMPSMSHGAGEIIADKNAPGGTAFNWVGEEILIGKATRGLVWEPPTNSRFNYTGTQRILVAARTPSGASLPWGIELRANGAIATPAATSAWQLLDMGVVSTASSALYFSKNAYALEFFPAGLAVAHSEAAIGGAIQLPDGSTSFLNAEGHTTTRFQTSTIQMPLVFDGVANQVLAGASMGVPASGIAPVASNPELETGNTRGSVPRVFPSATSAVIGVLCALGPMTGLGGTGIADMNLETRVNINVLEQTRYAF